MEYTNSFYIMKRRPAARGEVFTVNTDKYVKLVHIDYMGDILDYEYTTDPNQAYRYDNERPVFRKALRRALLANDDLTATYCVEREDGSFMELNERVSIEQMNHILKTHKEEFMKQDEKVEYVMVNKNTGQHVISMVLSHHAKTKIKEIQFGDADAAIRIFHVHDEFAALLESYGITLERVD